MFRHQLVLLAIIAILSLVTFNDAYAKHSPKSLIMDTTKTYKIFTKDKTEFTGKFIKRDSVFVTLITSSQTKIEIPIKNIKKIEEIESPTYKNGEYWFENPNASRYSFSSSAINLKKNQSYYQNTYIFLNSFATGITDNLSITGGLEFLSTFSSLGRGNFTPIYFIAPKLGFKVAENLHLGVGYFYSGALTSYGNYGSGYLYGVATLGNKNSNYYFTIGFDGLGFEFNENPYLGFSASTRVSKGVSLITDNLIMPGYNHNKYTNENTFEYFPYFSYGVRLFGEKIAVDLAFINNPEIAEQIFIGIPYVDFVVNF